MVQASLATFYAIFMGLTIVLNLLSINVTESNAIYRTITSAFNQQGTTIENSDEIAGWLKTSCKATMFGEQRNINNSGWGNVSWWNYTQSEATIGSFNRLLLVRFSIKRWDVSNTLGPLSSSTPRRLAGSAMMLDAFTTNPAEATEDLCEPGVNRSNPNESVGCFKYDIKSSFAGAGGYVAWFDPMEGQAAYDELIDRMVRSQVFDLLLGTFTMDFIVYNTNVDLFMQYAMVYTLDFAGNVHLYKDAQSFNLNVFNRSVTLYAALYAMRIACLIMLLLFLINELKKIWDFGPAYHFRRSGALTDMASIWISAGVLFTYWGVESMDIFTTFSFEDLANIDKREATYISLCGLASTIQEQATFIALNLLVVTLRTTSLISSLHSNLGLIMEVLSVSGPNFLAFLVMFLMLLAGFVLMSFFLFGPSYPGMATPILCIYKAFAMIAGDAVYDPLVEADAYLGPFYFFAFYTIFYLVLINIFVTLLMSGYDIVDFEIGEKQKKSSEKEKNPLVLIFDELKADVVGNIVKYGSVVFKYVGICLSPVIVSVQACLICRPPSFISNFFKASSRHSRDSTDAGKGNGEITTEDMTAAKYRFRQDFIEFASMLAFMVNWIMLMTLQARGSESYLLNRVTLHQNALDVKFEAQGFGAKPIWGEYDSIEDFEAVKLWADKAIVGLYEDPACAVEDSDGIIKIETSQTPNFQCNNSIDGQQLLNRISFWNIGFTNSTFVRLTVQPACFVENPTEQWRKGSRTLRKTRDGTCAEMVCTEILSNEACHTADGRLLDTASLNNLASEMNPTHYNFAAPETELGPYNLLGGYAFSLGVTKQQSQETLELLKKNYWFSKNSASMVFDWITYNGNMDMFTYNKVSFSLLRTGLMVKDHQARTFPMNVFVGGGFFDSQTLLLVLYGLYVLLLLYHIFEMLRLICREYAKSMSQGKSFVGFLIDFFKTPWHVADVISLTISLSTFVNFIYFAVSAFRANYIFSLQSTNKYVVPNDAAKFYNMAQVSDPMRYYQDDWYIFRNFEILQGSYDLFLQLASMNSLFISIKTIKIVNRFKTVSVFSLTLDHGKDRNVYFLFVIYQLMFGIALAMMVIFGTKDQGFSSIGDAMGSLCFWACGAFTMDPLLEDKPFWAVMFFVAFIVLFRFICTNMFLATQLNTFADLVGQQDIKSVKLAIERDKSLRIVTYHKKDYMKAKDQLKADIAVERLGDGQVAISKVLRQDGLAAEHSIQPGLIIARVNKQKIEWTKAIADDMIIENDIFPDSNGKIKMYFQEPPRKNLWQSLLQGCTCSRFDSTKKQRSKRQSSSSRTNVKPTVRNFWRKHGAIAEVHRLAQETPVKPEDEENAEEDPQADTDAEIEKEGDDDIDPEEAIKIRTKKRLDGLLFSRWPNAHAKKDHSALLDEVKLESAKHMEVETEDIMQDDWDKEDLKDELQKMEVSGQEVWLDCLITALEQQGDDESVVTEVLRTNGMQEVSRDKMLKGGNDKLLSFYRRVDEVLKICENKANRKYYQYLQHESEHRREMLGDQNEVLHDYVCELEKEFMQISETIHSYQTKKELMLTKLAGLLDRGKYDDATSAPEQPDGSSAHPAAGMLAMLGLTYGDGSNAA
eukprot:TRINITY_DN105539_c0_g1_i1.p1 TRINITY_DN105539_c0_g1~~TRINITY_DN105539_c0_g1_i1.p1  ORF type:complete len:1627 (-),score=332.39 TRINITY_DN105539_c0_g1_i1:145-4959(-)